MRTVSGGKARLGGALDAEEREELVLGMLLHTLAVLGAWQPCRRIHLVSPDPVLDAATRQAGVEVSVLRQQGEGLNEGIRLGIDAASAERAPSVLVLPGDLPHLSTDALDELLLAADAGMAAAAGGPLLAIVPSDARQGTNALLLRPPQVIAPASDRAASRRTCGRRKRSGQRSRWSACETSASISTRLTTSSASTRDGCAS
jgi:2-phospho-L-lactate guanylyltransferase